MRIVLSCRAFISRCLWPIESDDKTRVIEDIIVEMSKKFHLFLNGLADDANFSSLNVHCTGLQRSQIYIS